MNLKTEISEFWKWAKKTPTEYSVDRGYGEWEDDYPNWRELNNAIDQAIVSLNLEYSTELAEYLIQGLAVDNESECTLGKIEELLNNKQEFVIQVIGSNQPQAKWQIADLLKTDHLVSREKLLQELILEQGDKYVKRRALLSLNIVNSESARKLAEDFITDVDEYLSMVANKIVNGEIKN